MSNFVHFFFLLLIFRLYYNEKIQRVMITIYDEGLSHDFGVLMYT